MTSLRARMINAVLRNQMKAKELHLMDPGDLRRRVDRLAGILPPPNGVSIDTVEGQVAGEWHRPTDPCERHVYYLHGGGYVFGSPKTHRSITFALAKQTPANIFSLDYRLAPEHPFPAAVDDAVAGYRWLIGDQGVDPSAVMIAGDSAGGGLTMAMLLSCKAQGLPMPACATLFSPWADLRNQSAAFEENAETDVMFRPVHIQEGVHKYLNGASAENPLASPVFGDHHELPPTLIFASNDEILRDDSVLLNERLLAAGVSSTLVAKDGLPHVWPVFTPFLPEAIDDVRRTIEFFRQHADIRAAA
ncbi:MAG: alpha/beta hydrolase [Pseudomonadota bacterium]